jgi:hypothetical protein
VSVAALIETRDDGTDIIAAISMNQYGIENRIDCEITMKTDGNQGSLNGTAVVTVSDGEQKTVPMQGTGSLTWIDEETARNAQGEIRAEILNSDAPQALYMTMDFTDKDLGDHAKTDLVFTVGLAEGGALLTIKVDGKTDLAEAYIITDDAVDVAKMDEETSQALRNELQVGAAQVLSNLMTKLPEAAQQLLAQIMGGTQQASPAK